MPVSAISTLAISSAWASIRSPMRCRNLARSAALILGQPPSSNAARAARTARSTSSTVPEAIWSIGRLVLGSSVSKVPPSEAGTNSFPMKCWIIQRSHDDRILKHAQVVDLQAHDVTGVDVRNAARGPGPDHVPWFKCHEVRDESDQLRDLADHLRGVPPLSQFAVDIGSQFEIRHIWDLVGRHHARPDRPEAVEALGPHRRAIEIPDEVAGGDVVGDGVPANDLLCMLRQHPPTTYSNDDRELNLVVQILDTGRVNDGRAMANERTRRL